MPDALIGDNYAALSQKQFDIPEAQVEYVIQPDRVADKLGREAVAIVRVGRLDEPRMMVRDEHLPVGTGEMPDALVPTAPSIQHRLGSVFP